MELNERIKELQDIVQKGGKIDLSSPPKNAPRPAPRHPNSIKHFGAERLAQPPVRISRSEYRK